jgi:hypothetical protein
MLFDALLSLPEFSLSLSPLLFSSSIPPHLVAIWESGSSFLKHVHAEPPSPTHAAVESNSRLCCWSPTEVELELEFEAEASGGSPATAAAAFATAATASARISAGAGAAARAAPAAGGSGEGASIVQQKKLKPFFFGVKRT